MHHRYSSEEKEWLKDFIPGHNSKETVEAFKDKFGIELTVSQIRSYRRNNNQPCGISGKFFKGQIPYNKGKKWTDEEKEKMPKAQKRTLFPKGHKPVNWVPVGTLSKKGDYMFRKIAEPRKWILESNYVWQQAGRKLKKGMLIIHLNGDNLDNRLENLEQITRNELVRLNQRKFVSKDPELTRTALMQIRLEQKIRDKVGKHCENCVWYGGPEGKGHICNNPNYKPFKKDNMANVCHGYREVKDGTIDKG